MISLDTNVLVRYIMQDDPKQSPKATRLIESLNSGSSADSVGKNGLVVSLSPGSAIAARAVRSGLARHGVGCETARIF